MMMMTAIQQFHFIRPWWLLALIPLALLWLFSNKIQRKAHNWAKVCDPHLLPHLLVSQPGTRGIMVWVLVGIAWTVAILALAGPTWHRLPQPVYKQEINRVIVFDLSNAMRVTDIPPSRLVRARYKLLDLLQQMKEGQVGLVVYSGEPYVVSPLTNDANTIAAMVPNLSPTLMPVTGNNLASGLSLAAKILQQAGAQQGQIIVITAGKADADTLAEAKKLTRNGIDISVMGVGTGKNTPVLQANGQFLQDQNGAIVFSKLDPSSLEELASIGHGQYVTFSNDDSDIKVLLSTKQGNANFKQGKDKATTTLWQDEGRLLIWPLLFIGLIAFRRGWYGGRK
ncbi:MAG: vWA domain-containing protein [Gammaproteobacteria bacterium]